jgi:hypothetical protein
MLAEDAVCRELVSSLQNCEKQGDSVKMQGAPRYTCGEIRVLSNDWTQFSLFSKQGTEM